MVWARSRSKWAIAASWRASSEGCWLRPALAVLRAEVVEGVAERRPRGLLGRPDPYQLEQRPQPLLEAVEHGVFLAGEVVGEGAAGEVDGVGDRLDGDVVQATLHRQPQGGLVQGPPRGGLLALAQTWAVHHGSQ
jgi:hypothetical protein